MEDLMQPQRLAALAGAVLGTDEDVTVDAIADETLTALAARRTYTGRTLREYRYEFAQLAAEWNGKRVAGIRPRDVDAWVQQMRDAGRSTSRVRHMLDRLSQVLRHAVRAGYVGRVQVEVERPRLVQRTIVEGIEPAQLARLIRAAWEHHDRRAPAAVLLAARAGLRASEIAQLRGEDVQLARGYLRVEVRGETSDRTKSGRARSVPLEDADLRTALESLPLKRGARVLGVASADGLASIVAPAWTAAGLTGPPRLHRLRHTYATVEAMAGVPLPLLQRRLGHRTILTTMRYVHVPDEASLGHGVSRETGHGGKKRVSPSRRGGRAV